MSRRTVRTLAQLAATVLVTWFIVRALGIDLGALAGFDLSVWAWRPLPLAGSVLLIALGYVVSALLWRRMVVEMGGPRIGAVDAVGVFLVANLGRYVPGKVLQVAGLAVLAGRRGVPASTATAAAVLGQAFALGGATLLGLGAFFGPNERWRIWGWVGLAFMAVLILLSSIPGPAARLRALWFRVAGGEVDAAPSGPVSRVGEAGFGLRWTLYYLLNWSLYGAAFWLLFLGMYEWATFLEIAPLFAAAYVLGYLAVFAPAGGGVREGALVAFLRPVVPDPTAGLAFAILARVWTTVVELVPAGAMAPAVLRLGAPTSAAPDTPPNEAGKDPE